MSAQLWRQQGVLVLVAGVLLVIATWLVGWAGELAHQAPTAPADAVDREAVRRLTWAVAGAGLATATALVFALVHAFRVLSLTFKGEGS